MKKLFLLGMALPLLTSMTSIASAQSSNTSLVPNSGAYIGLGLGLNSTQFKGQMLEATGISNVTNTASGALVSSGTAGGPPVGIDMPTANGISPLIQGGYFQKLQGSDYLWGVKFCH